MKTAACRQCGRIFQFREAWEFSEFCCNTCELRWINDAVNEATVVTRSVLADDAQDDDDRDARLRLGQYE